jgi:hypothetical protein
MNGTPLPPLEPRLQRRYRQLVKEHTHAGQRVAAGLGALPGAGTGFASTQAAWRFYGNESVTLEALIEPLIQEARAAVPEACDTHALVMHDWSHLHYGQHTRKTDRRRLGQGTAHGYELQSALLVGDRAGQPLAPLCQNVVAADGLHTTRAPAPQPVPSRLDELLGRMEHLAGLGLGRPLVHIIDREADSVGHFRRWRGHLHLVRVKGGQNVQAGGVPRRLSAVAEELHARDGLAFVREIEHRGKPARQHVGERAVTLTRAARPQRKGQPRRTEAGDPVSLRLIVSEIRDGAGRVLAQWFLLSNVPASVDAATLALWYHWRWRIESFFKLVKGAGQQVEAWQQRSAPAVAKRLLVVSAACVLVWRLARSPDPAAAELRAVLVRLSGRQLRRGTEATAPAMLAGLWNLLSLLDLLQHSPLAELQRLAQPLFATPPPMAPLV